MPQSQQQQKPWSWHMKQLIWWGGASLLALGLIRIPTTAASPIFSYSARRSDTNAELQQLNARRLIVCTNGTLAQPQTLDTQASQPFFVGLNGTLLASWVGPTQTAYAGIFAQNFDNNNHPLVSAKGVQVDSGTWTKANPYIITTETGPVYCYNTVTVDDDVFCSPYSYNLQAIASTKRINFYTGYQQVNLRGVGRNGGGFLTVFQSNNLDNNANHYQMCLRGFQSDNVTPIDATELRVSTITNTNNINGQVVVNANNSGTVFWQRRPDTGTNHEIVKRSFAYDQINQVHVFTDALEVTITNTTLPGYDCINMEKIQFADGSRKLAFLAAPTTSSPYQLYVQPLNTDDTPNGVPVNIVPQMSFYSGVTFFAIPSENNGSRITITGGTGPVPQDFVINIFANNTLNGSPQAVVPKTNQVQNAAVIADRGTGRYSVGYECNSDICYQTLSQQPNLITQNNITLIESAATQTVYLPGFYVEKSTYSRSQITVSISAPLSVVLGTGAVIPNGASANYNNATGVLTLSATGSSCDDVMNNMLNCLTGTLQPYYRTPFNLTNTMNDDSGMLAVNSSVPVTITPVNYVPIIDSTPTLAIGQGARARFGLNITTVDNTPADQINVFVTNFIPGAALVQRINPVTGSIIQSGITQFTYQEWLDDKIVVDQAGNTMVPSMQLTTSSYNGPQSSSFPVNVQFYPTPDVLIHQITYTAKTAKDITPLALDPTNFLTQTSVAASNLKYTLFYGSTAYGHVARVGALDTPITKYTQQDVNTPNTLYFIPDGSGKTPSGIQVSANDGYSSTAPVDINFKFTVLQQNAGNNNGNSAQSQGMSVAQAIGGTLAGIYAGKKIANYARYLKHSFANFVYHEADLGYWNFSDADGKDFTNFVDKLVAACDLTDVINGHVAEYKSHWCFGGHAGAELTRYAKIFALHLKADRPNEADPTGPRIPNYLEKAEHIPIKVWYKVKGRPLLADVLDKDGNGNIVWQLSSAIRTSLEAPVQEEDKYPLLRMMTRKKLPTPGVFMQSLKTDEENTTGRELKK